MYSFSSVHGTNSDHNNNLCGGASAQDLLRNGDAAGSVTSFAGRHLCQTIQHNANSNASTSTTTSSCMNAVSSSPINGNGSNVRR